MSHPDGIIHRPEGYYCPAGDFYIDPKRPVAVAVISHAHSDHACPGCGIYYCSVASLPLLRLRAGREAEVRCADWRSPFSLGPTEVSFYPAGHILGSAQVRIAFRQETWVYAGDYNNATHNPTCEAFESVPCDVFITESTFALPIYRWPEPEEVLTSLHDWWRSNQQAGLTSVIATYPLGKTQRLLAMLDPAWGPIRVLGAGKAFVPVYHEAGYLGDPILEAMQNPPSLEALRGQGLVLTTQRERERKDSPLRKLGKVSQASVSGWMMTRAARRMKGLDRGFVLSDHADWPGLQRAIAMSGARRIGVVHGETELFTRWLQEQGYEAFCLQGAAS